jgi:putative membrane protein insertion efficiency factor
MLPKVRPDFIGKRCAFEPSCSRYAELSLRMFGFWRGSILTVRRLQRCQACNGGLDLPPSIEESSKTELEEKYAV